MLHLESWKLLLDMLRHHIARHKPAIRAGNIVPYIKQAYSYEYKLLAYTIAQKTSNERILVQAT